MCGRALIGINQFLSSAMPNCIGANRADFIKLSQAQRSPCGDARNTSAKSISRCEPQRARHAMRHNKKICEAGEFRHDSLVTDLAQSEGRDGVRQLSP
jgi:hypothetical protein